MWSSDIAALFICSVTSIKVYVASPSLFSLLSMANKYTYKSLKRYKVQVIPKGYRKSIK